MFEEEKDISYSSKFIGNFWISKEEFMNNKKWKAVIDNTLKKVSQFGFLSEWKIVSHYLESEIVGIIKFLCTTLNRSEDISSNQFLLTHQVNATYKLDYEWYTALNNIEDAIRERDFDKFEGLHIAHILSHTDIKHHFSQQKIERYKSLTHFKLLEKLIDNYKYDIDTKTSSSATIEYIIALYSIWESIVVSINDLWDIVFYKKEKFLEELNRWRIWYCLDAIFERLMIDELRDDLELIEKYFTKKKLIYSNRNEIIMEDMKNCINTIPNGRFSIDIRNWYAQSMSYDFKSIDCSDTMLHNIKDFVFWQWAIWFEYHQWKKSNILWTKNFNYRKQIKNEKIANE